MKVLGSLNLHFEDLKTTKVWLWPTLEMRWFLKQLLQTILNKFGYRLIAEHHLASLLKETQSSKVPNPLQTISFQPPLTPNSFLSFTSMYDKGSVQEKEEISRSLIGRCIVDPSYFRYVALSSNHELGLQLKATVAFVQGDLQQAQSIFSGLAETAPSPFNILTLGRIYSAMGNESKARETWKGGINKYGSDFFLTMELATSFYREGLIEEANSYASKVVHEFAAEKEAISPLQKEIELAIENKLFEKPMEKDIYSDDFVEETWWFYYRCYNSFNERQDGSVSLDLGIRRVVEKIIEKNAPTTFIDFGAFCGFTIAKLAEKFPNTKFIGIDRPQIAKRLNDQHFVAPNLKFIAGDIIDFLKNNDLGASPMLFHSRTAVFCYPEFLRHLYTVARERGVSKIVFQEGSTFFSRWFLKFFHLGQYPAISLSGRGSTFLHDYKRLLEEAGFEVTSSTPINSSLLIDDRSGFGADHRVIEAVSQH
jgi:tetratricopeptide (TPR) repeat protein